MDNLKTTNYDESIENFSFGSNVVNDELYTKVIYYIAAHKLLNYLISLRRN